MELTGGQQSILGTDAVVGSLASPLIRVPVIVVGLIIGLLGLVLIGIGNGDQTL